ncbi:Cys-tRNA(Pro) deacylase [Pseudohongiella spirulinae]|uniref:Cys-tRNA(Pro)/Cys-tRNA(Cys) deacylase n=1 Tax=Pseudohongiella spirulinae TaxID=1249552 RepID=A0A0S2KBV4_9GAMM|nr:Cys-tRNA(Pro) deacylase [Pseudohongiella spirulinae]ALO45603.1 Cys-tRNA(Pro)/Cys-tRNA(Cys) deacylase [Pseudohongiella spirulinae]
MTPAIELLRNQSIRHVIHEYAHDPEHPSYGLEAAEKLRVSPERVFKTLVASLDEKALLVAIVPVATHLDLKALARAAGGKKTRMAAAADVQRSTGYVLGGVSPLAQKRQLRSFIDQSAQQHETIYISAGRRGLEVELGSEELRILLDASFAALSTDKSA